jgi:hypothetical protein
VRRTLSVEAFDDRVALTTDLLEPFDLPQQVLPAVRDDLPVELGNVVETAHDRFWEIEVDLRKDSLELRLRDRRRGFFLGGGAIQVNALAVGEALVAS